jgi:P4 family phage/plasmid primase-like protien
VGNDTLTGAELHRATFDFQPTHHLWLSTNHRPAIDGGDVAIVDRLRLIPFQRRFAEHERDPELKETLQQEREGILAWAIKGAVAWHRDGLGTAAAVGMATEEYRAMHDTVGRFLEECCELHADLHVGSTVLYGAFETWCRREGMAPLTLAIFGERLRDRGHERSRGSRGIRWCGIGLREPSDEAGV